jgi:hypothetical protein
VCLSIIRAFLVEEQKMVKSILKGQQAASQKEEKKK